MKFGGITLKLLPLIGSGYYTSWHSDLHQYQSLQKLGMVTKVRLTYVAHPRLECCSKYSHTSTSNPNR